jgi:hypothetical protein
VVWGGGQNMRYRINTGYRRSRWLIIIAGLVVIAGSYGVIYANKYRGPIPKYIKDQIHYKVYAPDKTAAQIDSSSFQFSKDEGVLTYAMTYSNIHITLSQQAEPEVFRDGPVYQHLLNKMHQYGEVKTLLGTVTLTHPEELKGGQTAVANNGGTLFFARPDKDLNSDQWRDFFNELKEVK